MTTKFSAHWRGGKGNMGRFIERDSKVCAAGKPTSQPQESVKDILTQYNSLQDEVNALIGDAVIPLPKSPAMPHKHDMRNAGIFNEGRDILNPPMKTKFETLVADFKNTRYKSYWAGIGEAPDRTPLLPDGFKTYDSVLGKRNTYESLYDIIMPLDPIPDKTPNFKKVGYQSNRNYCLFNPNITYGQKTNADPSGNIMKRCLKDNHVIDGHALTIPVNEIQAKYQSKTTARLGIAKPAIHVNKYIPEGYTFGKLCPPEKLPDCLRCGINPYKEEIKKCLGHLNTLRKCLAKRFEESFYRKFYLSLKFLDESKTGWLQKQVVYNQCNAKFIYFNPSFIEPLLSLWHVFNGSQIEYKTFLHVINPRQPTPEICKIQGMEHINFSTTYSDAYRDSLGSDKIPMAGIPSGRYFDKGFPITPDNCCKADRFYLPEESDAKACLSPSILTLLGVTHRDMYAERDPKLVRMVFENAGEIFKDDQFETIWQMAKKYHSQEWVCYETFRRSMVDYKNTHNLC